MAAIGMRYAVWAELTSESNNTLTYGTGRVLGRARSFGLNWEKEDNELYADDAVAETDQSITGYTVDLETSELLEADEAAMLGYNQVGSTNEYEITDDDPPYGGTGYVQPLKRRGVRLYKAVWYPKVQFSAPNESAATKEKSITWQTPKLSGKGLAVYNDATGKAKFRRHQVFSTLESARAYLNAKANIT